MEWHSSKTKDNISFTSELSIRLVSTVSVGRGIAQFTESNQLSVHDGIVILNISIFINRRVKCEPK